MYSFQLIRTEGGVSLEQSVLHPLIRYSALEGGGVEVLIFIINNIFISNSKRAIPTLQNRHTIIIIIVVVVVVVVVVVMGGVGGRDHIIKGS